MAKGTDSDDFVSMSVSEPRSDLKRNHIIFEYSRKRFKKSGSNLTDNSVIKDESATAAKLSVSAPIKQERTENGSSEIGIALNAPEQNLNLVMEFVPNVVETRNVDVATPNIEESRGNMSPLKPDEAPLVVDDNAGLVCCLRSPLCSEAHESTSVEPLQQLVHEPTCVEPLQFKRSVGRPRKINRSIKAETTVEAKTSEDAAIANGDLQNISSGKPVDSEVENMSIHNNSAVQDAFKVKPSGRFSRLALECMTKAQIVGKINMLQITSLDTPLRRFTRSALGSKDESPVMEESTPAQATSSEKPLRRFTRSALNVEDDSTEMLDAETHGDESNGATDISSPNRTPSHKKLEMKMSKKIGLTNFPTKINELLYTGLLEGLSVEYVFPSQKKGVLQGTIKDCGILCSCSLCKGCKVVTATKFERHAGSTNRNPALFIYLDNGNNLRDVLNACKDAPRDMLEAAIQMAIASSVKNAVCLNCKKPKKTRGTLVLCNSCLVLKRSQSSSACTPRSKQLVITEESDDEPTPVSPHDKSSRGKLTRKDLRLHKLVFEKDGLPDGTELGYYVQGKKLLEGYKKGLGIFCFCCNSEISPSQFEAHAGWAKRRKPYLHIYTSNGVSLHELSISLHKERKFSAKDNDDLCGICGDFGDLLLCDGCPRSFHKDCVGEVSVPRGKWYCTYCQNMFQNYQSCASNANALAAGRVSGVDPIEQISKRCIRIVNTPEPELGGCTLCWVPGFNKSGFGPRTIIFCDQCEKEFHVGCLKDHNMADLKEKPEGKWFCTKGCSRINIALEKCVVRGPEELPDSITKLLKMKPEESNISWRLLSGKVASPESRSLLSKAVAMFHNRFDPIVDAVTGRDLIPRMVYGKNMREQDFSGMFCAVLTVNSSVVSAGLIRVLGQDLAELPLVATSSEYQGQGYFYSLFCCIERLLGFLNVKTIVLPAAEEAEAIWTQKFGFQKLSPDQVTKYTKEYQLTVFRGTAVLQKPVPKCRILRKPSEDSTMS